MDLPTYLTGTTQVKAYRILRSHVYEALNEYDLTPTYWSMLGIVAQAKDGVRQAEIARSLHVKAPLVTSMSRKLEAQGLIQIVPNQFDARAKLLALSTEGKRFIKQVEVSLHAALDNLLRGLTQQDLEAYHKVLETIIANDEALKS